MVTRAIFLSVLFLNGLGLNKVPRNMSGIFLDRSEFVRTRKIMRPFIFICTAGRRTGAVTSGASLYKRPQSSTFTTYHRSKAAIQLFNTGSASSMAALSEYQLYICALRVFNPHQRLKFVSHPSINCITICLLPGRH